MAIPVLSVEQMREWERASWTAGMTEGEVIEQVGKIVAERALELSRPGKKILILAGKGHNGDDARAAQKHLTEREIVLLNVIDPKIALREWQKYFQSTSPKHVGLIIDGLFGIGLNRLLSNDWQKLIRAINNSKLPVLSIDVPSGLDADTGKIQGEAIRATVTLTLGAPKRGLISFDATKKVGRLEVAAEIGLIKKERGWSHPRDHFKASRTRGSDDPHSATSDRSPLNWILTADFHAFPPARSVVSHKGTFGHLAVVAGSLGFHGAAVLATRGALRAQPGLVTLFTPEDVYLPVASQLQAAMVHPWNSKENLPHSCTAILFGPGLAAKDLPANLTTDLATIWKTSSLPVIADASALEFLPAGKTSSKALRVITPHPGEAARMLKIPTEEIQKDRVAALRQLSQRYGNCFVVLKGHQTLIGRHEGEIFINSSGNPFLAQGGSGDLLSGYLGGLLAQPGLQTDPAKTICYAVWQHGSAADRLSREKPNWTIDELAGALGLSN